MAERYNRDVLAERYLELLHAVAEIEYVPAAADEETKGAFADRRRTKERTPASSRRDADPDGAVSVGK